MEGPIWTRQEMILYSLRLAYMLSLGVDALVHVHLSYNASFYFKCVVHRDNGCVRAVELDVDEEVEDEQNEKEIRWWPM